MAASMAAIFATGPAHGQNVLSAAPPEVLATPEGRLIIKRGQDYVPSTTDAAVLAPELESSMRKRREFGWSIVEKMLAPQHLTLLDGATTVDVPLWQTWYEGGGGLNSETKKLAERFLDKLKPLIEANPQVDMAAIAKETVLEFSEKNLSDTLTDENLSTVLLQLRNLKGEVGDLLGRGFTVFSPSFVEHVLTEARGIDECQRNKNAADPPPSDDQFSHCVKEFPRSAVMVKTSWRRLANGVPKHDTSPAGLAEMFKLGIWPQSGSAAPLRQPTRSEIYTNVTSDNTEWALRSIHFVTKDVREWVWVSLWWDPNAKTEDFGSDQPASLAAFNNGVWKNYKMCVVSAFAEKDPQPWASYTGSNDTLAASIKAVYDAIQKEIDTGAESDPSALATLFDTPPVPLELPGALGPWPTPNNLQTEWCSNPNIEAHVGNGRTSCIGCHQFPMTRNEERDVDMQFEHAILGDVPQFGRAKVRENFPAEFAWSFDFEFHPIIQEHREKIGLQWPPH
ncbi:hypothetical protein ACWUKX_16755 [Mesorhizobium sp. f-mel]